jgi:cytochrome bd-type quinol oxidase subunit 2
VSEHRGRLAGEGGHILLQVILAFLILIAFVIFQLDGGSLDRLLPNLPGLPLILAVLLLLALLLLLVVSRQDQLAFLLLPERLDVFLACFALIRSFVER